ncbi:helix-turn-helix domain-containing protein [Nesterenkonia massiliensis]|uniref:Helix-turn-helix domain-containing protein n=1 Tax=Nesterenkonia massiliensis TaxID=1232429 RepID=A0ABT2HSZ7_9MICC|nr:helix-turn-helix domain-containing protein [Nesterenkonia massiliensis]MCT1607813.1 helix-turn-helix domain-containing protein [Nesterenkonia massiliensis]
MSQARRNGVQSVERALEILEVIASRGGATTLSELAHATGLPTATAHRLLRTMTEAGFVVQLKNRSYGLGDKLGPIGEVATLRTR